MFKNHNTRHNHLQEDLMELAFWLLVLIRMVPISLKPALVETIMNSDVKQSVPALKLEELILKTGIICSKIVLWNN